MILHLPMLQVLVPGNVTMFFSAIIPVAMFDVLESEELSPRKLLDFDDEDENGGDIFDQMRDLGYETHSSVLNLGTLFVLLIFYALQLIYCGVLALFVKLTKRGVDHYSKLKKQLFFNGFFGIIIEAYMEFLVSAALNFTAPPSQNTGEVISKYVSWLCFAITLVICPFTFHFILKQPISTLKMHSFEAKWGALYEGLKLQNKWQASYYIVFCARRVLFVFVAFFLSTTPTIQLQLVMFMNIFVCIYVGSFKPLNS
jgi:hypothetical protein